jgi:hypothetical protein
MASDPRQIITAICPDLAASPSLDVFLGMAVELTDRGFSGSCCPLPSRIGLAIFSWFLAAVRVVTPLSGWAKLPAGGLSVSFATGAATSGSGLETTKY